VAISESEARERLFGETTLAAVLAFQRLHGLQPTGIVDLETARRINEAVAAVRGEGGVRADRFVVRGTVRQASGEPFTAGLVQAFDQDMRSRERLGEARPDAEGRYEIVYTAEQFGRAEKRSADLRVGVTNEAGRELALSEIRFNAARDETIDLVIPLSGVSEYERYNRELDPPIRQDVPIPDLTDDDRAFLAPELGIEPGHLDLLVAAHRLARVLETEPELLYGLFRGGLPSTVKGLAAAGPPAHRRAIEEALKRNIAPVTLRERLDERLERLHAALLRRSDEAAREDERPRILGVLATTRLSPETRRKVVDRLLRLDRSVGADDVRRRLVEALGPGEVDELETALRLDAFAGGNLPLVQDLQRRRQEGEITGVRDLTNVSRDEWKQRLRGLAHAGEIPLPPGLRGHTPEGRLDRYVAGLLDSLQAAFPEDYLRREHERQPELDLATVRTLRSGHPRLDPRRPLPRRVVEKLPEGERKRAREAWLRVAAELRAFPALDLEQLPEVAPFDNPIRRGVTRMLENVPELSALRTVAIDRVLAQSGEAAYAGIAPELRAAVSEQLKATQRILRVVLRPDDTMTLLYAGFRDAASVARLPQRRFVQLYGQALGGVQRALAIHRQARHRAAASEILYTAAKQAFTEVLPYVIGGGLDGQSAQGQALAAHADLATLFGSQDYCDCEHCRSVYSPAAYLVDLLHFLDVEPPPKAADAPAQSGSLFSDLALLGHLKFTISPSGPGPPGPQPLDLSTIGDVLLDLSPAEQPTPSHPELLWIAKDFLSVAIPAPAGDPTPLEVLLSRRPDLEHLRLSCENTLTPIPYIDLVNEVLESYLVSAFVDAESPPQIDAFDVSGATAEELRAVPQHVNDTAYEGLKQAVYPALLPFDRPREVVAAYFGHLGASRHELMTTVPLEPSSFPAEPGWGAEEAKAAEALGLSRRERDLIVGAQAEPLRALYGYESDSVPVEGGTEPWQVNLARAPVLLQRTGLTLDEIIELLRTQFLNPNLHEPGQVITGPILGGPPPAITLQAEGLDCDLAKLRLRAPDDAARDQFLDLAQRFMRLRHRLGWSIPDLDRALASLGGDGIVAGEDGTLAKLAALSELKKRLRRASLPDLRTLWSDIEAWGEDSLYARLFRSRAVADPEQLAAFALNPDGTELATPDQSLADQTTVLLGAFGFTAAELEMLLGIATLVPNSQNQPALNLTNLSTLYRYKVLARALRLRLDQLVSLIELAGVDPFSKHDPRGVLEFVGIAEQVDRSHFDVPELDYLLRNRVHPARDPSPSAETVGSMLAKVRATLAAAASELAVPGVEATAPNENPFERPAEMWAAADPTGTVLRERLALAAAPLPETGASPADIVETQGVVEVAMGLLLGERAKLPDGEDAVAYFQSFFSKHFDAFLAPSDLAEATTGIEAVFAAATEPDRAALAAANVGWLYTKLMPWLWQRRARGVVVQALSDQLRLDSSLVRWLLDGGIESSGNASTAMEELLRLLGVAPESAHEELIRLLHKCAMAIRRFALSEREVVYLSANGVLFDGFDLDLLAPSSGADPVVLFGQWRRLSDLTALRDGLPKTGTPLVQLFEEASEPNAEIEALRRFWAQLTGWSAEEVTELTGAQGLDLTIEHFRTETRLRELFRLRELRKRVGVALPTLRSWATIPPDANQARAVVQAVKAKYDHDQWLDVARGLNDPLRERQRNALVAYLLPRMPDGGSASADQLFEHFLMDVQMSSCMATSRIKQAISSVQLFVQRCLLNLEPEVSPDAIDAPQWKWRKNYRVWEANRKVFLYPENWIEPELRLDKSPFFRELESELLQNELSEQNVERAFLHYLQKLDEVARLEVCGLYWEAEPSQGIDAIHVFGRTSNPPRRHFYRRLLRGKEWTPWEAVEIDIQSDHLVPVVFDGRLLLFWADFVEKPIPDQDNETGAPPQLLWEIRIQWSEYQDGRWTAPMTSAETINSYPWIVPMSGPAPPAGPPEPLQPADYLLSLAELGIAPEKIQHVRDWFQTYQAFVDQTLDPDYPTKPLPVPAVVSEQSVEANWWNAYLEFWFTGSGSVLVTAQAPSWKGYAEWRTAYLEWRSRRIVTALASQIQTFGAVSAAPTPGKLPPKHAHTFRIVPPNDRLEVECLVHTVAEDLPAANVVGRFWMDRCRGEVKVSTEWRGPSVNYPTSSARTLTTASNTLVRNQGFSSRGTTLAPFEFQPASDVLLKVGTSPYVIPPAQYPLFSFPLPFALRTHDRTYLARPVRHRSRPFIVEALAHADSSAPFEYLHKTLAAEAAPPLLTGGAQGLVTQLSGSSHTQPGLAHLAAGALSALTASQETLSNRFVGVMGAQSLLAQDLRFYTLQHPWVCDYIEELRRGGLDDMLRLANQTLSDDKPGNSFGQRYQPTSLVAWPRPRFDVDFEPDGAYSSYNWELFFHTFMLIAERCREAGLHDEARRFYHYIFDPTTDSQDPVPKRFWKLRPFRDNTEYERVVDLVRALGDPAPDPATAALKAKVAAQVEEWERRPFEPHRIARLRLVAYQKTVVMKYVRILIDLGDLDYRLDTIESINEATQLYVLAASILGQRPRRIPAIIQLPPPTFAELRPKLAIAGELSNPLVALENVQVDLPFSLGPSEADETDLVGLGLQTLAFCVPNNDKMLSYWDTVEDRLFKIRHCMNIEGIERELPLFEPPIDPALLVKAVAAGLDLGSVLADLHAPLPPYRFAFLMQRAQELVNELKPLGASLLAAKEKCDAEAVAELRASHERAVLEAMKDVRQNQITEAMRNREALEAARAVTEAREKHYRALLEDDDRNRLPEEDEYLEKLGLAQFASMKSQALEAFAAQLSLSPGMSFGIAGTQGSPLSTLSIDASNFAAMPLASARIIAMVASQLNYEATKASIEAGWERRDEEWGRLHEDATLELHQLGKQILKATISETIARQELTNLEKQIEQAREVEDFLRYKYTNQELYNWMVSEISTVYYQAYKLAYDTAKRCERAFRFEQGLETSSFIQFGYWDSGRKGLMAGERLAMDLRRLEAAYLEKNRREYEITKHVSLLLHDPIALIQLKESGRCEFDLPESLFDADYPGHYFRRIKSVSLTIPAVVGPYASVNCTLTLLRSTIRTDSKAVDGEDYLGGDEGHFFRDFAPLQSITTSHAQNDSGVFELSFRDERYLPCEGAGVVSRWRIELPKLNNAFDLDTISDVVLTIRYTAREGGARLAGAAREALELLRAEWVSRKGPPLLRLFSLRHEFPDQWHAFMHPIGGETPQIRLSVRPERFPFLLRGHDITVHEVRLYARSKDDGVELPPLELSVQEGQWMAPTWQPPTPPGRAYRADFGELALVLEGTSAEWTLRGQTGLPYAERVDEIALVVAYSVPTD
jgi:Tc toxin complex TcA C-terminal TcB-binding domain/Neuraminidase-like domain/Putative peptidoglycan binding domain